MKLVVGLGNPGSKYETTRHNAGFLAVTRLAAEWGAAGKHEPKLAAVVGEGRLDGAKVILAQPTTFMNLSGEAVAKLLHWYKLGPADLIVVYDDFSLPLGSVRVRPDGSAGGHNGISSILQHLKTPLFDRVRVGIGPLPAGWKSADFVLGRFSPGEKEALDQGLTLACEAVACVARYGTDKAMQTYNGVKPAL